MKKKALSLLLALTLCFAPAVAAMAVGETSITDGAGITYYLSEPVLATEEFDAGYYGIITVYTVSETTVVTPSHDEEYYLLFWEDGDFGGNANIYKGGVTLEVGTIFLFYYWGEDGERYDTHFLAVADDAPDPETPSSWAAEAVNNAVDAGLVPNALQGQYTTATTRAEFCALAVALYETVVGEEIAGRVPFDDTSDVNVEKMASLGVVNGVGDNKFAPGSKLTREQAATMLSRLADAIGNPLTSGAPAFNDNAEISDWAYDAVGQMQATGIMTGVGDNTFSPGTDYTREQSIITIMRLFDIVK